ncbi:MAG: hypothetical protein PHD29_06220 [bacterium]|nr:hypothetical protein [bacterium]
MTNLYRLIIAVFLMNMVVVLNGNAGERESVVMNTTLGFAGGALAGSIVSWGIAGDGEIGKVREIAAIGSFYAMVCIGTDLGAKQGTKNTNISRVAVRNSTLAGALISGGISYLIDRKANPYKKYSITYKNGKKVVTNENGKVIKLRTLHWYLVPIGIISGAYIGTSISF